MQTEDFKKQQLLEKQFISMGYLERDIEIILLLLRKQEWKKLTANKQVD